MNFNKERFVLPIGINQTRASLLRVTSPPIVK
jgi:hypothetical protein